MKCTQAGCGKQCDTGVAFFRDGIIIDEVYCPDCFDEMVKIVFEFDAALKLYAEHKKKVAAATKEPDK